MSHTQHGTYYVKLNRFFNIQAKKSLVCLAVLLAVVVLYVVINLMQNTLDPKGLLITVVGCTLVMVVALLSNPKCLTVTPETVKFQYRGALLNFLTAGRVKYSSNEDSRYEKTYTLYNIKSIEYFQTPLEKAFSCGHIRICGNVDAAGEQTFVIYGVKDFENTTKWMQGYIKTVDSQYADQKGDIMNRVIVIGGNGSGKSTFAKKLHSATGLPLVHLDRLLWYGDWQTRERAEFDALLDTELQKDRWIIDGNYNRTIPKRLSYCDTVFYFDFSTLRCLWGVTWRVLTNLGRVRDDMGGNCRERFDLSFYKAILGFNKAHRERYHALLREAEKEGKTVVIFHNRRKVKRYLNTLR